MTKSLTNTLKTKLINQMVGLVPQSLIKSINHYRFSPNMQRKNISFKIKINILPKKLTKITFHPKGSEENKQFV
jgi:hypothetical protein